MKNNTEAIKMFALIFLILFLFLHSLSHGKHFIVHKNSIKMC
jgi:hypothetical protein